MTKNVVDDELKYKDYKKCLCNKSYMRHEMNRTQGKDHNIGSYRIDKTFSSSYSDKKCIFRDGYSRLSYSHKSTR